MRELWQEGNEWVWRSLRPYGVLKLLMQKHAAGGRTLRQNPPLNTAIQHPSSAHLLPYPPLTAPLPPYDLSILSLDLLFISPSPSLAFLSCPLFSDVSLSFFFQILSWCLCARPPNRISYHDVQVEAEGSWVLLCMSRREGGFRVYTVEDWSGWAGRIKCHNGGHHVWVGMGDSERITL